MNNEIFEAIKNDDIKLFEDLTQSDKSAFSLCLGRFPLLSLCYLYNAKKITRWYQKKLDTTNYVYVSEPQGVYEDFKKKAQKSLRFFMEEGIIVSPLEMLSVLNSPRIERAYPQLKKTEKIRDSVQRIFEVIHGLSIDFLDGDKIKIEKMPLKRINKVILAVIVCVALVFSTLPLSAWALTQRFLGIGTQENPFIISRTAHIEYLFKESDKHFVLKNDITLPEDFKGGEFSGTLDGGGKTIYLKNMDSSIFTTLSGTIKNINFSLEFEGELTKNTGLVAYENQGTIDNISFDFGASIDIDGGFDAANNPNGIEFALFSYVNSGTISNSIISIEASIKGGAMFSPFVVENNGIIEKCSTSTGSFIDADTVDIAGIAVYNFGTISECENNASLSQTTSRGDWSPLVAGIALENHWLISECVNNGDLSVSSTSDDDTDAHVLAGGITFLNYLAIVKCKNNASITLFSKKYYIYSGGITAYNIIYYRNYSAYVEDSASIGQISASSDLQEGIDIYCGGIAGYNYGFVANSYSITDFVSQNSNAYFGGITGLWRVIESINQHINNYYLKIDEAQFGTAAYITDSQTTLTQEEFEGLNGCETVSQIQESEVFW